jgi:hypothetical protein
MKRDHFLGALLVLCSVAMPANGAAPVDTGILPVRSSYAFTATVSVGAPIVTGQGPAGLRRFIPITGGTVSGPMFNGRVVPGSGDWQVVRADGAIDLEARYTLEATTGGTRIAITNRGMRVASPSVTERITRGDPVAPGEYYFRTVATIEAPLESPLAWMNQKLFIGVAERRSDAAIVHFYRLD